MPRDSLRGRPRIANNDDERCEALTIMTAWKIKNKRDQRCPFMARFQVQGHRFCRHHAVKECFAIGFERRLVRRLVALPPTDGVRVPTAKGKR